MAASSGLAPGGTPLGGGTAEEVAERPMSPAAVLPLEAEDAMSPLLTKATSKMQAPQLGNRQQGDPPKVTSVRTTTPDPYLIPFRDPSCTGTFAVNEYGSEYLERSKAVRFGSNAACRAGAGSAHAAMRHWG